jgi:hypothetical protein
LRPLTLILEFWVLNASREILKRGIFLWRGRLARENESRAINRTASAGAKRSDKSDWNFCNVIHHVPT